MTRHAPARLGLALAAVALSVGFVPAAVPAPPVAAQSSSDIAVDPQAASLTVSDLRPGFTLDPAKSQLREPVPGITVYEADFAREQTPENFRSGPIEIKSLVARTPDARQAAEQFASSRQALTTASPPWTESRVAKLGDEAVGLSMKGTSSAGPAVAHLYLFRRGAMVVGITVAGLERPTTMAEAEALAAVVLGRIDPATRTQRGESLARPLTERPPSTTAPGSGAAPTRGPAPAPSVGGGEGGAQARMRVANTGGTGVRLRTQPSRTATVAATLPDGTTVDVVGEDRQADGITWKNVRAPGDGTGWVSSEFLVAAPSSGGSGSAGAGSASGSGSSGSSSGAAPSATATPRATGTATPSSTGSTGASGSTGSGGATGTATPRSGSSATPAEDVLTVDVSLAKTEVRDGDQTLTIKVTQQGRPVEGATATVRTTREEQPSAPPTGADGTTSITWTPSGEAGFVGVGVSVTAPSGATGVGSTYFNLLTSR